MKAFLNGAYGLEQSCGMALHRSQKNMQYGALVLRYKSAAEKDFAEQYLHMPQNP